MEYISRQLCVSASELMKIVSKDSYYKMMLRNKDIVKMQRGGGRGRLALSEATVANCLNGPGNRALRVRMHDTSWYFNNQYRPHHSNKSTAGSRWWATPLTNWSRGSPGARGPISGSLIRCNTLG